MALVLLDSVVAGRRCRVAATERSDGDVHPERVAPDRLRARHLAVAGAPWCVADQVHGSVIWRADRARSAEELLPADIVVGQRFGDPVAVWSADCATLLLVTDDGRLVGVHAGWRGLAAGAIDVAVDCAEDDGASVQLIARGPVIGPCCYEFGAADLRRVADGVGASARDLGATTRADRPALDVAAAVDSALSRRGLAIDAAAPGCTGCSERWWSHRVGADPQRQALVGWWS